MQGAACPHLAQLARLLIGSNSSIAPHISLLRLLPMELLPAIHPPGAGTFMDRVKPFVSRS